MRPLHGRTAGSSAGAATTLHSGGSIALQSVNAGGSYEAQATGTHQVIQDLVAAGPLSMVAGAVKGGRAETWVVTTRPNGST